jgi:hypothetical protein
VPGYLQHANVVIVPHVVSTFTDSLDPIKAYECLAVGTVTVSTPVAGFRDLGDPVVVVAPDRFVTTVRATLEANAARSAASNDVPSWRSRAEQFAAVLTEARSR